MKRRVKRKQTTIPKGLPHKKSRPTNNKHKKSNIDLSNPFESARASSAKAPKFQVHNRKLFTTSNNANNKDGRGPGSALQRSIADRRSALRSVLEQKKKAGAFIDRRIGESNSAGKTTSAMTEDERMLARLVRERTRRSKGQDKFALEGGNDVGDGALSSTLTHKGTVIDESYSNRDDYVILSDDDNAHGEYGGQLERADVEMHFGGGAFDKGRKRAADRNPYGPGAGDGGEGGKESLGDRYRSRKEELDEMIMRKKWQKAEKAKDKETQAKKFEGMDDTWKELSSMLEFRDKRQFRMEQNKARKDGTMTKEDREMEEWDKSMKEYMFTKRVKATDRTKTPEEIAKEKADTLEKLEARRLKRMAGDFEDEEDDLSDDDTKKNKKRKEAKKSSTKAKNPDELDSDVEEPDELEAQFTADGLVYVDRDGNVQKDPTTAGDGDDDASDDFDGGVVVDGNDDADAKSSDGDISIGGSDDEASVADDDDGEEDEGGSSSDEDDDGTPVPFALLAVGNRVKGKFNVEKQFEGKGRWYRGTIINVVRVEKDGDDGEKEDPGYNVVRVEKDDDDDDDDDGEKEDPGYNVRYDVEYDDGDVEKGMKHQYVRRLEPTTTSKEGDTDGGDDSKSVPDTKAQAAAKLQKKRQMARNKARAEIPYTFEVPTTLEALHSLISTHATTGTDTSLIIQRIHLSNSIRLDRTNREKMQNYYDVLLRRFIAVGDALYRFGDGGENVGRSRQLDVLTKVLYDMAQDSPEIAGAVWGRRVGVFQSALAKRLRDASELMASSSSGEDEEYTVWPSPGTVLLLRAVGQIFPVTDARHVVVTPTLILLGQILAQTPVRSVEDLVRGIFCAGLMVEFTREARRVPPEALAFISNVLTLYGRSDATNGFTIPTFVVDDEEGSSSSGLATLRQDVINYCSKHSIGDDSELRLSFERQTLQSNKTPVIVFLSTLRLIERSATIYGNSTYNSLSTSTTQITSSQQQPQPSLEMELFDRITRSLLHLNPTSTPFPTSLTKSIAQTAKTLQTKMNVGKPRLPLSRRTTTQTAQLAIESLAPRMEDPDRYTLSRDRGKTESQAKYDKHRREYKREHKAVSRELRLDARFIERERRDLKEKKDGKARSKRNKNFAWMESEQAVINQQVAQGGGLLSGGGIGVALAKKASGKIGIKKGGKF